MRSAHQRAMPSGIGGVDDQLEGPHRRVRVARVGSHDAQRDAVGILEDVPAVLVGRRTDDARTGGDEGGGIAVRQPQVEVDAALARGPSGTLLTQIVRSRGPPGGGSRW